MVFLRSQGFFYNYFIHVALDRKDMITVSKGLIPPVLAQGWENDLGTRPDMSIKVGC